MLTVMSLPEQERRLLTDLEGVVSRGLSSFVEVGNALAKIRDNRLYRAEFETFEDYCKTRWNITRQYASLLIVASEVDADLSTIVDKPKTESQARQLASVPREERAVVWQEVVETAPRKPTGEPAVTARHVRDVVERRQVANVEPPIERAIERRQESKVEPPVQRVVEREPAAVDLPKPHVTNNSGNNEWYTPPEIIEAARRAMGRIDCDPASSSVANRIVKAGKFFSAEKCGLSASDWGKCVWMNPPYSQPLCSQFCESLVTRHRAGQVEEACVLVNNATETGWFTTLASGAAAIVFLQGRVKFLDATLAPRNTPLQGQAVLYFGKNTKRFFAEFKRLGWGVTTQ